MAQSFAVWGQALLADLVLAAFPQACARINEVGVGCEDYLEQLGGEQLGEKQLGAEQLVVMTVRAGGAWYRKKFLVMSKHARHDSSMTCGWVKRAVQATRHGSGGKAISRNRGRRAQCRPKECVWCGGRAWGLRWRCACPVHSGCVAAASVIVTSRQHNPSLIRSPAPRSPLPPSDTIAQCQHTCRRPQNLCAQPRPRGRPARAPHDAHPRCHAEAPQVSRRPGCVHGAPQAASIARILPRVSALPAVQPVAAQTV